MKLMNKDSIKSSTYNKALQIKQCSSLKTSGKQKNCVLLSNGKARKGEKAM